MMNMFEVGERLKDFSKDQLVKEMQAPSGLAPQFMVLSELQRRTRMEQAMKADGQGAPQSTVAEDAVAAAGVPQGGIADMARALAPQTDMTQNTGVAPVPAMAEGGVVSMQVGGLLADPAFMLQARRMGMSPQEYLDSLGPAQRRMEEARVSRSRMLAMEPRGDGMTFPSQEDLDRSAQEEALGMRASRALTAPAETGGLADIPANIEAVTRAPITGLPRGPRGFSPLSFDNPLAAARVAAERPQLYSPPTMGATELNTPAILNALSMTPAASEDTSLAYGPPRRRPAVEPAPAPNENVTFDDWRSMSRSEREAAGLPVSELGGQLYFRRFQQGLGLGETPPAPLEYGPPRRREFPAAPVPTGEDQAFDFATSPLAPVPSLPPLEYGPPRRRPAVEEEGSTLGRSIREAIDRTAAIISPFASAEAKAKAAGRDVDTTVNPMLEFQENFNYQGDPADTAPAATPAATPETPTTPVKDTTKRTTTPTGPGGAGGPGAGGAPSDLDRMFEQDKWLSLARFGMALMSSQAPTFGQALGEAGAVGLDALSGAKADYLERKQAADLLALRRAAAAGRGGGGRDGAGGMPGISANEQRLIDQLDNEIAQLSAERARMDEGGWWSGEDPRIEETDKRIEELSTRRRFLLDYYAGGFDSGAPQGTYSTTDIR